ncbi:hypothetical protein [Nostoc sp.]|uniref:hypothetical protein n=1 Tax=Nostoc sp. TaxID=1180 RepID=UPI002FF811CF
MQCNSGYVMGFTSEDKKLLPGKPRRTLKLDYVKFSNLQRLRLESYSTSLNSGTVLFVFRVSRLNRRYQVRYTTKVFGTKPDYGLTHRSHCVAGVPRVKASAVPQVAARLPQAV